MVSWAVTRGAERALQPVDDDGICQGVAQAILAGPDEGALHVEVALVELAPGGTIQGHLHPFEESFYILEGEPLVTLADRSYRLAPHDWGYAPVSTPHAWSNPGRRPVRWLRTRSPQPRRLGTAYGTYPEPSVAAPTDGRPVERRDRGRRFVGHFDDRLLPAPGPLQMKGFRSSSPTNVGLSMLVDEVVGAVHHTLFVVQFNPTGSRMTLGGQHFHPFEETYYILSGRALAHLEDETVEVGPGDLVFAGVNALHGFSNPTDAPVRWLEVQAPIPPTSGAFFFVSDWAGA